MACTHERGELIADLAGGRLDADATQGLLEHVEGCPDCSAELDLVADLVRQAPRAELAQQEPDTLAAGSQRWPLVAAALILLALGAWWTSDPGGPGAIDVRHLARLAPAPAIEGVLRGPLERTEAWNAAMTLYSAGEYRQAADALGALRADGDRRALLDLYLGIAAAQTGDLELAADALARAGAQGEGMVRARARWYRAQVHLAANEGEDARGLLTSIADEGGDYAPNAAALLKTLDALE